MSPAALPRALAGRRTRGPILAGAALVAVLVGGLGTLAATAPLARGAVAAGQIVASAHRKAVQHLEGGIVAEILVRDGDVVKEGQLLVRMDDTQVRAKLASLRVKQDGLEARIARLDAEQRGRAEIVFPDDLARRGRSVETAEVLAGERQLFAARRQVLDAEVNLLGEKCREEQDRIKGLEAQVAANRDQVRLTRDELVDQIHLLEKGYARRPHVLDLERRQADLEGRQGALRAEIAQARIHIAEAEIEAMHKRQSFQESVAADLRTAQDEVMTVDNQIQAARDVLSRLDVRASEAGAIHNLKVRTIGGVVSPGDMLMEIVPEGGPLVVEARVAPLDVEHVSVGIPADIRFTGLSQRTAPTVAGRVVTLSPDVMTDGVTNASYYQVRVEIPAKERARLAEIPLVPGMPADVVLKAGERTVLDYVLEPLTLALEQSFKE